MTEIKASLTGSSTQTSPATFAERANALRHDLKAVCRAILALRGEVNSESKCLGAKILQPVSDPAEMAANLTLTYRHLEDASMRLGKAIQAWDGGVSVYDKQTTPPTLSMLETQPLAGNIPASKTVCIDDIAGDLYTAYCAAVGGKAFTGDPLPTWTAFRTDSAKLTQVNAWLEVARLAANRSHLATKSVQLTGEPASWQDRLLQEKADLDQKIAKLRAFFHAETFKTLPADEQGSLTEQVLVMDHYSDVLAHRIESFTAPEPAPVPVGHHSTSPEPNPAYNPTHPPTQEQIAACTPSQA